MASSIDILQIIALTNYTLLIQTVKEPSAKEAKPSGTLARNVA